MFPDHLKKVDEMPYGKLFAVVAGLVFLCQLAALVLVVNGQVEKAHLRDAQYSSAQMKISDCSNTYSGAARRQCIEQVNAALDSYSTFTPETETRSVDQPVWQADAIPSAGKGLGYMETTLANRQ